MQGVMLGLGVACGDGADGAEAWGGDAKRWRADVAVGVLG